MRIQATKRQCPDVAKYFFCSKGIKIFAIAPAAQGVIVENPGIEANVPKKRVPSGSQKTCCQLPLFPEEPTETNWFLPTSSNEGIAWNCMR